MAQFARPSADVSTGSWTTAPLWSKINESDATGDGITIASEAVGNNTDTTHATTDLTSVTDPAVSTGHIIRLRWASSAAQDIRGNARLLQGGVAKSVYYTADLLDATEITSSFTLTASEADSITNYADLEVEFYGRGLGGGPSRSLVIDKIEFEVPDAGGQFFETLAVVATLTPSVTRQSSFLRTLAIASSLTVSLTRQLSFLRTLAVTSAFAPVLARGVSYLRTLAVDSAFAANMVTGLLFTKLLEVTSAMTAGLSTALVFGRTLAVTSVMTPVLQKATTFVQALSVTSSFSVAFIKQVLKTLSVTSSFVPALSRGVSYLRTLAVDSAFTASMVVGRSFQRLLEVTALMTPVISRAAIFPQALATISTFVSDLITEFQAGGGGVSYWIKFAKRWLVLRKPPPP